MKNFMPKFLISLSLVILYTGYLNSKIGKVAGGATLGRPNEGTNKKLDIIIQKLNDLEKELKAHEAATKRSHERLMNQQPSVLGTQSIG